MTGVKHGGKNVTGNAQGSGADRKRHPDLRGGKAGRDFSLSDLPLEMVQGSQGAEGILKALNNSFSSIFN